MVNNYLKQSGAWAIAYWERYGSDLFFRTSIHLIGLQAGFVFLCIGALTIGEYRGVHTWALLLGLVLLGLAFGAGLIRLTIKPARDTLRYQKLFISNIAHELRTPLSTIKTHSEVALFDEKLSPALKSTFGEIIMELNRVSEIINNLLSLNVLARPERIQFKNLDLVPLAEDVVARLEPLARERRVKITLHTQVGSIVWGNVTGLEQVMSNLVKNALSYTPTDSRGKVDVLIRPQEGMVLFSVADTGIGMSQEELFHIFEPFYRADSSRNRQVQQTGSGLGLTIVNEMVRAHRGRIHVQSQRRKGTTVSVLLPLGGAAARAAVYQSEATLDFSGGRRTRLP